MLKAEKDTIEKSIELMMKWLREKPNKDMWRRY